MHIFIEENTYFFVYFIIVEKKNISDLHFVISNGWNDMLLNNLLHRNLMCILIKKMHFNKKCTYTR